MTVDREVAAIPGLGQLTLANANSAKKKTKFLNILERQDLVDTAGCRNIYKESRS